MRRKSVRLSSKKSAGTSQDLADTVKRRLFEDPSENRKEKDEATNGTSRRSANNWDQRENSVSAVGIWTCIVCVLLVILSYCLSHWFWFESKIEERDGQLYLHLRNNQNIYLIGFVTTTIVSTVCALLCCCASWTVTYFDSLDPGKMPPTPISPHKYRKQSGHTFHTSYVTSLLNSVAVALYVLWWRRTDYVVL